MNSAYATEALDRARNGTSAYNDASVVAAFLDRGIPERDILPRINCLSYGAWQAEGRQVQKGERGVKVRTWVPAKDTHGNVIKGKSYPRMASGFHVSQTAPKGDKPKPGKVYRLMGRTDEPAISNGDTWSDSVVGDAIPPVTPPAPHTPHNRTSDDVPIVTFK